jgi:hypothetical protein
VDSLVYLLPPNRCQFGKSVYFVNLLILSKDVQAQLVVSHGRLHVDLGVRLPPAHAARTVGKVRTGSRDWQLLNSTRQRAKSKGKIV